MAYETKSHRRIWIEANGPIPLDEDDRTYEIHHINGDHSDNRLENLACLSIQEHFEAHYKNGDWEACILILRRMNLPPDVISERQSIIGKKVRDEKKGIHTDDMELRRKWARNAGIASAKVNKAFIDQQSAFKDEKFAKEAGAKSGKKPATNGLETRKFRTDEERQQFIMENEGWRVGQHWNNGKKKKST